LEVVPADTNQIARYTEFAGIFVPFIDIATEVYFPLRVMGSHNGLIYGAPVP